MIHGRINIAFLNKNQRIIINNTEEIKAELKQLRQFQPQNQMNINGDVSGENTIITGNKNIVIYFNITSYILNYF